MFRSLLLMALVVMGGVAPQVSDAADKPAESLIGTKAGDTTEITLPGGVTLKQVWCPPGTFTMGSLASEKDRSKDEDQVEVELTKGFWLGQTEVTQAQWTAVMGAASTPWSERENVKEGPTFPASFISHGVNADGTIEANSATAFCEKLTEIERKAGRLPTDWKYALPTEAQWEYACRADTKTAHSFGDDESQLGEYAWFRENADDIGEQYAHAVGTKKANPWGLSDMHGNVWEWCQDRYDNRKLVGGTDPLNDGTGKDRVLRGGSWYFFARDSRSASRSRSTPDFRIYGAGFRVSRTQ